VACDLQWAINSHLIGFVAGACVPDAHDDDVIVEVDRHGPVEVAALCEGRPAAAFELPALMNKGGRSPVLH
jgi:hypothetical protein